ncbi:MAG: LptF/LptG family permease, partial [Gammaproteobacteria bacterium]|nr:LptF/LptG family permease [Gammaproteobacteria bacterium]
MEKKLPNQSGHYIIFNDGYRYSGVPGEKDYRVLQFEQYGVRLAVSDIPRPNVEQYYSISKLWSLSPENKNAAAELQWRMAMPISTLVFALLAVPLSEVRPRYGKFTQLFPAILIYISYADLIFLSRSWISDGQLSTTLGMWWVHG